jgi:lipoprotein-anchoring transpeptidase ErfK/SrfK
MGGPAEPDAPLSFETPDALKETSDNGSAPDETEAKEEAEDEPKLPINTAPDRVKISIDKSDHTLTVRFDDEAVAQFPVGLGRGDATPEGQFTIANKITDPDWFDRGRVVKAGDPENPLGSRWMGLGTQGRATSYGIHPTDEPESIGADMSRGCIRMRPDDAKTVFRLCPVGTVVSIVQ